MQSSFLKKLTDMVRDRQDVVLAVFVVAIIFMMIVPLPTLLVDTLLALNISLSVVLLMVAVYLRSPLEFASFPAVLLLTTLFRLSLSICTTRLILLDADAGHVVSTFGEFVVGGNLVVGIVVFLILTVVNFIVITKGAERVAEVGARFSLDAMPGRQLSIDSDLRNGTISQAEAKNLRAQVAQESKLLGSMDGAMKFVKGDAIASIIIVFVNLLGGLAIGMWQKDMSFAKAMELYSVLSIGDGLVAQVPALLISICAGIIVTRVSDETKKNNLAKDITQQVMAQPKALSIGAFLLVVFSFVPGFPTAIFLTLAAILAAPAIIAYFKQRRALANPEPIMPLEQLEAPSKEQLERTDFSIEHDAIYSPTTQLLVELSPELEAHFTGTNLRAEINKARLQIYFRLGVSLPPIDVRRSTALTGNHYRIFVSEIPSSDGELVPNSFMVFDHLTNLDVYNIPYTQKNDLMPRLKAIWVEKTHEVSLKTAQVRYRSEVEVIAYHAEFVFAKYVAQFIGIQHVKQIIDRMELTHPELIKEVQRVVPIQMMTDLLKRLVQEFVCIRDLPLIFAAMIEWGGREKDPVVLVEHLRIALARQISHQYAGANNILNGILLDGEIEETVRNSIRQTSAGSFMQLEPEVSKHLINRICEKSIPILANGAPVCLITAMDIRRYVRRLIEAEIPELPVLSYQEIANDITLQPIARVQK